jgi:hypothetical protein
MINKLGAKQLIMRQQLRIKLTTVYKTSTASIKYNQPRINITHTTQTPHAEEKNYLFQ